jgi:hypothetical protein
MSPGRTKSTVVAAVLWLTALAAAPAAAKPTKVGKAPAAKAAAAKAAPPPPNTDQQLVVARIVDETFPRPKRDPVTLALCLDVRIGPALDVDDEMKPAIEPPRRGAKKRARKPEAPLPDLRVQGAPAELVERLARPWRLVASASSCRLDPRQPFALPDERHTPAQLVTVHLAPDVAVGTIKIDWTDSHDPTSGASRDCTAARGTRGWEIHCGGTWFQ